MLMALCGLKAEAAQKTKESIFRDFVRLSRLLLLLSATVEKWRNRGSGDKVERGIGSRGLGGY